ncbi:MAG: hypothetical protein D3909_12870, partial [Candidatus Electrothrix sp. ATG1]|nr:hypothetical protein [Candidatus Electrothrix sp. ATG1]MCI5210760.1 hypothetical protein [Candidatus Electrothrix sp. ATG2]
YAPSGRLGWLWCSLIEHPCHIFWWLKLYGSIFLKETLPEEDISVPMKLRDVLSVVKNSKKLVAAMWQKVH